MGENPVYPVGEYVLGSTDPEMARLAAISRVYGRMTGAWLDAAGVGPGMRVADLGCGPGDVTLAAARCVGPTGSVIGVDDATRPLERARLRGGGGTPPPRPPSAPAGGRRTRTSRRSPSSRRTCSAGSRPSRWTPSSGG